MKSAIRVLAVTLLAGVSGCASMPAPRVETDVAMMNRVDSVAQHRGVLVVWVHPPLKKVAEPSS